MEQQVVHVRINDAATGQPTPVRIRFVDAAGRYRAPLGRLEHFPTGFGQQVGGNVEIDGKKYAYIDGTCEVLLPAGPIQVEVHKGFEYVPVFHTFDRAAGQISLRLAIERKFNLEAEGLYAGDMCAHFLSPQAAWLEGAAEGLHVVNLLAAEWEDEQGRPFHSNLLDFSGQAPAFQKDGTLVAVNTLNRGGQLGDLLLLNCHRVVYPLRLGAEGFAHYTPADWCRQCHRKDGLVVGAAWLGTPPDRLTATRSGARDLGQKPDEHLVDALEWSPATEFASEVLPRWYEALKTPSQPGLSLVGGSHKDSNALPLGAIRTYALVDAGGELSYRRWIEAVRRGATFATRGPLLELQVGSSAPGGAPVRADQKACPIRARARSVVPYGRLEVVCNGEVIAQAGPNPKGIAVIDQPYTFTSRSRLVARCWGTQGELLAHTSPCWVLQIFPGG
jgi:hypothetical protein